jgi:surface antigen
MKRIAIALIAFGFMAANVAPAFADPPPWAPAWGARSHGKGHGKGKDKHKYKQAKVVAPYVAPFGLDMGRCNRERLGQILGGAAGGALGSTIGKGDGRTVAVIGGTLLGVLIGGSIGRSMDQIDQNCVGQVLEHAPDGQEVAWKNPNENISHTVVPVRTFETNDSRYCREYTSTAVIGGATEKTRGTACRQPDGRWLLKN